jgi:hypothetical protein
MENHYQHCFCIEHLQDLTFLVDKEVQETEALLSALTQSKSLIETLNNNKAAVDHLLMLEGRIQVLQIKKEELKAQVAILAHSANLLCHQCIPNETDGPSILSALLLIKHKFTIKEEKFREMVSSIQIIISHL